METAPVTPVPPAGKTTPRDFFLWAGAVIALYGSVFALITLLFEYVNRVFPDPLAYYGDPYAGSVRFAMATLIVLVPTALILLRLIRNTIIEEPMKAGIWVRRWALVLTIFIASATVVIDLITLINTFLGGEITTRFLLKVLIVLLIALGVSLHFWADLKGYWIENRKKANTVGLAVGVLVLAAIVAGFFIIGTPKEQRLLRFDEQKVADLQSMQYQVLNYWQQKQELPASQDELADPLSGYVVPMDPQTGEPYRYEATGDLSFRLCATFNGPTLDLKGRGGYPAREMVSYPGMPFDENWQHEAGETCFDRTIDPERYPPYPPVKPL